MTPTAYMSLLVETDLLKSSGAIYGLVPAISMSEMVVVTSFAKPKSDILMTMSPQALKLRRTLFVFRSR